MHPAAAATHSARPMGSVYLSQAAPASEPGPSSAASPTANSTSAPPSTELPLPAAASGSALADSLSAFSRFWQPNAQLEARWIRLDGVRLFQIAGWGAPGLEERQRSIQQQLNEILQTYLRAPDAALAVEIQDANQQQVIYINGKYLLTVTELDAQYQGLAEAVWAEQVRLVLAQGLEAAQQQRQPEYLWRQTGLSLGLILGAIALSLALDHWQRRLARRPIKLLDQETTLLLKRRSRLQQTRLQEVQRLLLQTAKASLWIAVLLLACARFPQTRPWVISLGNLLKIPLTLLLALLLGYVLIRLSHLAIDRFCLALSQNPLLPAISIERTQQRIGTLAQVAKGLTLILLSILVLLVALVRIGVDVGPLLAGAGILGVGVSLASQGLIKDAINGVLIILEDQYGIGDIVEISDRTGLVETLNLRMTQLRTSEGKLITIPNGEIKIVANLSSHWSQVDLNIPVAYEADLEAAMAIIETTALAMSQELPWQSLILEPPQLKGVEDFSDRGLLVKLWIKTQPLKQWDVAREYRRRLKHALHQVGIEMPVPQQSLWLHGPAQAGLAGPSEGPKDGNQPPMPAL